MTGCAYNRFATDDLFDLDAERARELVATDPEKAAWALLELSAMARALREKTDDCALSTPSSTIPPYKKASRKSKRRKKPGRSQGHAGARRAEPKRIDRREAHQLESCPECGGNVSKPRATRRRIIEDLTATGSEAVEHTIASHYCPACKKRVEPKVACAPPGARIGYRSIAMTSYFHYSLGVTISKVSDTLNALFDFKVSDGGLVHQWKRVAETLEPWYDRIRDEAAGSAVLHVDETGWRVDGKTHWLWGFFSKKTAYYLIDPTRSSNVPFDVLKEAFDGILITDFYAAYNRIDAKRQLCLAHLFRELKKVSNNEESGSIWEIYVKDLKRLLRDAIRLSRRRDELESNVYKRRRDRIGKRLEEIVDLWDNDANVRRIDKRLKKYRDALFTFLDEPDVPFDNNHAERELRPAVIARKNSFHNMSDCGARTQSILMSIYRTLKLRGLDPIATVSEALQTHTATGILPPLPSCKPPD